jgi:transposase-like protein
MIDKEYNWARLEHVWRLRQEGLTFKEIAPFLGVHPAYVNQMFHRFDRWVVQRFGPDAPLPWMKQYQTQCYL